jgi:sulfur carrier protein ThiS
MLACIKIVTGDRGDIGTFRAGTGYRSWARIYRDIYVRRSPIIYTVMKIILPDQSTRVVGDSPGTVEALLLALGINPLEVIVSQNGALVSEHAVIGETDEIRIIRIAHGG